MPSADAVYRYLKSCNLIAAKIPKNNLPQIESPKVKDFHDLWEMDAQGAEHVKGIGFISMINIKDAKSKAYVCSFPVHVKSTKGKPKTVHYLWALRLGFEEFGLPKTIQVDKDSVFIDNKSKSAFPSQLHLFLIGLGIELSFIDVSPPQKQGMVERSHQTLDKQALQGKTYENWQALFVNINKRRKILNEHYPSRALGKKAPLVAFPKATHSGRPYLSETENDLLKIQSIEKYLTKCKWYRKVSANKTISLHGKIYYLKNAGVSTHVQIRFYQKDKKLIFRNDKELVLREILIVDFVKNLLQKSSINQLVKVKNKIFKHKEFPL